jgi:hypothetical protein
MIMVALITPQLVTDIAETSGLDKAQSEFALQYLEYYYVNKDVVTSLAEADISQLIINFQTKFGLPTTGRLDEQTVRAMHWPRCGCPDYETLSAQRGGRASKWGIKSLTYYISDYVSGISKSDQEDLIDLAYQQWEDHCELDITRVDSSSQANMVISTGSGRRTNFDGPGGTLAWAYLPPGNNYNGQLLMRFDLSETWTVNSRDRGILFLNVACHEFGHFLGLDHSNQKQALMAPYYTPGITKPQSNDDIPRIQSLYGQKTAPSVPEPAAPNVPNNPSGDNSVTITGVNMSQISINGKSVVDFTLI